MVLLIKNINSTASRIVLFLVVNLFFLLYIYIYGKDREYKKEY